MQLFLLLPQLELLPSTLPGLLGGDLTTPLVLWCDSHVTSDMGDTFKRVASRSTGLSFAWINRFVLVGQYIRGTPLI